MEFNSIISNVAPSKSVTLLSKAKEMQKTDPDIINLTGGEPDFPTPKPICDVVTKYLAMGYTHYTDSKGDPELRERLSVKLKEDNNAPYSADNILITPGGKYAVYLAVRAILNSGDEALWLTPGWVSYPSIIEMAGGKPVAVHLKYDEDYRITAQALESAATEKTKLLIINYPNNPTGKILTESDISELTKFLRNHPDIYVISDEIYEKIVYDGNKSVSMASFPEFFDRVVIVNGFSKCAAMTGWRVGYLACGPKLYKVVMKLFQHTMSCTSGFIQKGALKALDCADASEEMRAAYERRRNLLAEGIKAIPGVEFITPPGAFYAWLKFDTDRGSEEICNELLEKAKIAGVPGNAYGEEEKTCVRFSFASSDEELKRMLVNLDLYARSYL